MADIIGSAPSRRRIVAAVVAGVAAMPRFAAAASAPGLFLNGSLPQTHADSFTPFINQNFIVWKDQIRTSLTLIKVQQQPRDRRPSFLPDPFSLIFRGMSGWTLPADIYQVMVPNHIHTSMFVTPISNKALYEAPFN